LTGTRRMRRPHCRRRPASPLAAPDIGLRFVIGDDQLDRPAVDAADRLMRATAFARRPARSCRRRQPRRRAAAATDLVRLGRAPNAAARRRHQHRRAITPAPQPTSRRRVTLPLYQKSSGRSCSFHFLVIVKHPSEIFPSDSCRLLEFFRRRARGRPCHSPPDP